MKVQETLKHNQAVAYSEQVPLKSVKVKVSHTTVECLTAEKSGKIKMLKRIMFVYDLNK